MPPHTTDSCTSLVTQHPTHIIGSIESLSSCSTVGAAIAVKLTDERLRCGGALAVAGVNRAGC